MTRTTNSAPPEAPPDQARRVVFATSDPEPARAPELPRLPRDGEGLGDYVVTVARAIGVIPQDASLSAARKRQVADEMIERAEADELFGGSRAGKALLAAQRAWAQANPAISPELGSLGSRSRDMAGRAIVGPSRAVALVLEALTDDEPREPTAAEAELLRSLAPAVAEALRAQRTAAREQREAVLSAVNAAQAADFPAGQPGTPIVREPEEA